VKLTPDAADRLRYFLAGAGFAVLFVAVALVLLACHSSGLTTDAGGWKILDPGVTIVQTPCALIYIEIRANDSRTAYFWRIAIVPIIKQIPVKPEVKPDPDA
jgi:hypothetical protein